MQPIKSAIVALTCLATLSLAGCGGDESKAKPPAKQVVVLTAYHQAIADRVEALGTTQSNESIDITPNTTGIIDKIEFTDGQSVQKGDTLVLLELDEERAQLAAAKAQLAEHVREIARLKKLLEKRAAAQREYEQTLTLAEVARNTIKEIESRIDDKTLKAPFDGVVGIRRLSPGALVQPGQIITTLDQTDPIKLDFSVPATYLARLVVGATVEAEGDALPGEPFTGKLASIDTRIDPVTRSILLRALLDNPGGRIKPGMLMRVTLLEDQRQALVVPEESVTQKEQDHFLDIVRPDNTVDHRKVEIGLRLPGLVEISGGLAVGEKVIVRGMGFVKPGQKVQIEATWTTIRDHQFPATPK